jgi:hypothetical protein
MKIPVRIHKSGTSWIATMPILDGMTQGRSRLDAARMAVAWIRDILDRQDIDLTLSEEGAHYVIRTTEPGPVIALMLRRQREASGLSLAQVSQRLGRGSRNAYARYEQGLAVPSVAQLDRLITAVSPEHELCLQ